MKHKKTEPFTQIPFCVLRQTARSFRFYSIFKVGIFINRLNPVPCGMMLTGRNTDAGGSDGATNCMVGDFAINRLLSGAFLHRVGETSACRNAGAAWLVDSLEQNALLRPRRGALFVELTIPKI